MAYRKWKVVLGILPIVASSMTCLSSCSYVRPQFTISGDAGALIPHYTYHYNFSYRGIYISNIIWTDFSFTCYDDNNGVLGNKKDDSWMNKVFKPFNQDSLDISNSTFTIKTQDNFDNVGVNKPDFFLIIGVKINNDWIDREHRHFSFNDGLLDMVCSINSKPSDYYDGQLLPDGNYDSWSAIDPNFNEDGSGYIYRGEDSEKKVNILKRLKADVVQETINALACAANFSFGVLKFIVDNSSPNNKLTLNTYYNYANGEFKDFSLTIHIDGYIGFVTKICEESIDLTLKTDGTFVLEGAFNSGLYDDHEDQTAITGNYLTLCAKSPNDSATDPLTKLNFNIETDGVTGRGQNNDFTYSHTIHYIAENLNESCVTLSFQSYYLSKLTNIQPISLANLSWDKSFYDSHPDDIPTFHQKDEPDYPGFYTNEHNWENSIGLYYDRDSEGKILNEKQPYFDLFHFIQNQNGEPFSLLFWSPATRETFVGLPWQQKIGVDPTPLYWNSVCYFAYFVKESKNTNSAAADWYNKPGFSVIWSRVFAVTNGTPRWIPDFHSPDHMWAYGPRGNSWAMPPGVIRPQDIHVL